MKWWMRNNLRMVQNNIRDIDVVRMDIDKEIRWLKDIHANCLQIGCGGITAHHETSLESQVQNPLMKGDFLREIVDKCHSNGIHVIARFDFSKVNEKYLDTHPDWFSRTLKGDVVRYHDTVATCVNGEYQREEVLRIIREVIENYDVDGIFFNMFGYITKDYSGNYVGICQCENCKRLFRERYGLELPVVEDEDDPVFRKYQEFKRETVHNQLQSIRDMVKGFSEDIAISTYATDCIDIVRNESNSAVDRPLPHWIYDSSDNVCQIEDSFDDKIASNVAINAVDLPYRFMGVSDSFNRLRLYGNIAAGSGLDWCIIGNFDDYPDMSNYAGTKEVFAFHEKYEEYYGSFERQARIILVCPGYRIVGADYSEFRGVFKMLKERHLLFEEVMSESLPEKQLDEYDFIILPGIQNLNEETILALEKTKACVVATGASFYQHKEIAERLFSLRLGKKITDVRSAYLQTKPESVFPDFASSGKKWVYLDMPYYEMELDCDARGMLPLVTPSMYGPPERCYGNDETDFAMVSCIGSRIYFPWSVGSLYFRQGYEEFKHLFFDVMASDREIPEAFDTNCPEMIEMFLDKTGGGDFIFQVLNKCGFNGSTVFRPLVLKDLYVRFRDIEPKEIFELGKDGLIPVRYDGKLVFDIDDVYKAFIIKV